MIDINCDMGESIGDQIIGQDEQLMPYIDSCNIACGFHGGDYFHMNKTIKLALKHQVRIGAHPSYPDLEGFGRREMHIEKKKLKSLLINQIESLKDVVEGNGGALSYVKPHGALYNKAAKNSEEATTVIEAMQTVDTNLALMGLAGSALEKIAKTKGVPFIAEAFCDRKYENDGSLMSRLIPGSVYTQVEEVVNQAKSIVYDEQVVLDSGKKIKVIADSICIHGDNPMALELVKAIRHMFKNQQYGN